EAASEQHTDIVFAKVDTDAEQELSAAADIRSIPTLWAFREGVLVFAQPGALPAASLEQVIAAVRGLDMAEVHRQVAEQRAAHEHTHHEHADHEHADHELADQAPAAEQRATGT